MAEPEKEDVMQVKNSKYPKTVQPQRPLERSAERTTTLNGTVFMCDIKPEAKEVFLVGDFNNWDTKSDRLAKKKGCFQKTMRLAPGEYQYKFFIDGEWHCDPAAPKQVPNRFGTLNSVIRVEANPDE
jgi:1,4-alpha-glucan branching enzyme